MQPDTIFLPSITGGLDKTQVKMLATNAVDRVIESGDVFQAAESIAAMEEFVKNVRKDERFVSYVREELEKNNGRLLSASGAKIENCEAGVNYDYSRNSTWLQLQEQISELEEKKKKIEEKLRSIPAGKILVDEETGEVWEGAVRSSRSTYKITLSKGKP